MCKKTNQTNKTNKSTGNFSFLLIFSFYRETSSVTWILANATLNGTVLYMLTLIKSQTEPIALKSACTEKSWSCVRNIYVPSNLFTRDVSVNIPVTQPAAKAAETSAEPGHICGAVCLFCGTCQFRYVSKAVWACASCGTYGDCHMTGFLL